MPRLPKLMTCCLWPDERDLAFTRVRRLQSWHENRVELLVFSESSKKPFMGVEKDLDGSRRRELVCGQHRVPPKAALSIHGLGWTVTKSSRGDCCPACKTGTLPPRDDMASP